MRTASDGTPIVEAHPTRGEDGLWTIAVECPYCGDLHTHGGNDGPEPQYGHRGAHCLVHLPGKSKGYILRPADPGSPPPKPLGAVAIRALYKRAEEALYKRAEEARHNPEPPRFIPFD